MIAEFRLPDLGEGLPEAELVQWLVAPGDTVALNQPIAEVETAKAVVELPSPFAGTVTALHAAAGDLIPVGAPVIAIQTAQTEEATDDADSRAADAGETSGRPPTSSATARPRVSRGARNAARAGAKAGRVPTPPCSTPPSVTLPGVTAMRVTSMCVTWMCMTWMCSGPPRTTR